MTTPSAAKSGSFKIGGDIEVHRLGYGAMRITGDGIWGEPKDRAECLRGHVRLHEADLQPAPQHPLEQERDHRKRDG